MAADPARRDARPIVWMIGFLVVALVVYFVILGQRGFGVHVDDEFGLVGVEHLLA